ncbi:hypothetical protein SASPL_101290 [Salvia splendens]|uniref:AT-hook motif nuclear-localized protein n=1 Tax=Salvia splendens TaxID=180675 RepID=A0A8X9ABS5_SALSN|nr:AT-hook motif nuclear-localized protein 9-like [Salvia splendens]KAG6436392.1 hypothetical protein SASPL_101290 [Salvia splendens]
MDVSGVRNSIPTEAEHDGSLVAAAMIEVAVENGGGFREKRKRGRPRKQLGGGIQPEFRVVAEDSGGPQKRGRGRPKGSGKWQILAASFDIKGGSNFSPYIIDVEAGENIAERIRSFSERTCDSADFSIIRLNGSHTYNEKGGAKLCLLSVHLADSHNNFYGGAVAGSLIAAGPTQIIVGIFRQNLKQKARVRSPNNNITITSNENGNGTVEVGVGAEKEEGGAMAIINVSAPHFKSFQPPSYV